MNSRVASGFIGTLAACALAFTALQGAFAAETAGVQLGILQCKVIPGTRVNLLVRSTADVGCTFDYGGVVEKYRGETGIALGLDLSIKNDEQMAFGVIAASSDVTPGAYSLAGKYVGGQASAAAGVGVGAKVLIGGGKNNISLQPLALETSTGIGASGGLGFLYIEKAQ
ncbi:MAG: DUF992 domain-containing protein [Gammaproteobacteria bacterium]|nr:DUF992 domain-containing protein [Gammaproteobacteria bacterium]